MHHLYRRDRCRRSSARHRHGRRQRRARTDTEPDAGRDGRIRGEFRRHRDCSDQPRRCAGQGATASRPLRPSGDGGLAGHSWPRADPECPCTQSADFQGCADQCDCTRHAWLFRRRTGQSRERGGVVRRTSQQAGCGHAGLRRCEGQDHHGPGTQVCGDARGRASQYRLSRVGPCGRRCPAAESRSGAQGHDHAARLCTWPDLATAGT